MKYWLFFWVLFGAFLAYGQSDYERAVRLFEEADSIRISEEAELSAALWANYAYCIIWVKAPPRIADTSPLNFRPRSLRRIGESLNWMSGIFVHPGRLVLI